MRILVGLDGGVINAEILISSGVKEFDDEALRVANEAKFTPARKFGKPVYAWVGFPIKFKLKQR